MKNKYLIVKKSEWIVLIMKSIGVMLFLDYFFYKSLWALPVLAIPGFLYGLLSYRDLIDRKKNEACTQFKELLLCSATGLRAGYSVENAILQTSKDLKKMFGKDSFIYRILNSAYIYRKNNQPLFELFQESGMYTGIDALSDFGEIYEVAYKMGGDLASVLQKTAEVIVERIKLRNEMYIAINERLFEMKIMTLMPFFIMLYVTVTSPSYFDAMYHNPKGVAVMSLVLLIYMGAYGYARKSVWVIQRL